MSTPPIHIRLPDDLREAVEELAQREDRTILGMIRKLLREAIEARKENA